MTAPTDQTAGGTDRARDEALRLLADRDFAGAVHSLTGAASNDPSGESEALLGLAHFHSEHYNEAAQHFAKAVESNGDRADWKHMLAASRANADAEADVVVPPVHYFDRDLLLGPPEVPSLPEPAKRRHRLALLGRIRHAVGHAIGSVGGVTFEFLMGVFGRHYRGEVWTNWYRKRLYTGILTLGHMRELLNRNNLKSTYPTGTRVGFQPDELTPPPGVTHFRTADGSWNNLDDPKEGAAGTRFPRNVANAAIKPADDDELMSPNPRLVSRTLLTRGEQMKEVPFLNLLAASWIQFQNHDWITHGDNLTTEIIEIPLADDDPARRKYLQSNMFVGRTQPDPTRQAAGEETPVTFINEVTHWWDGSQLYGSDQETQDRLRSGVDGKLRLNPDGRLPVAENGVEDTGMVRNWWVGLSMLHDLFAREHNAICDHLKVHYPEWEDARLFNVARLVNAAVMAKIHSIEWTPAILPNRSLELGLNSNWYGMLTYKFRKGADRKTVADFNVSNPELGGLVGNRINKHGSPFGLTEEFVEVYRLHSLLPESLRLRSHATGEDIEDAPFAATRQAGSHKVTERIGMANLFYSFGNQHPGQLVLNNFPRFMQELSVPGNPVFDMGAVDILRARERGVPRYNEFRRQLGLNPIGTFDDLTDDASAVAKIKEVYGEDVEQLDLLVGTLAEGHRPTGFGFGETMFQIFILNASRRLQADRFYTDDYRPEVYTQEGMDWVDDSDFKSVILRHFPELAATGLGNVTNAFEPWDTDVVLDPARHPLREFHPELKRDPWKGEAADHPPVESVLTAHPLERSERADLPAERRLVHSFIADFRSMATDLSDQHEGAYQGQLLRPQHAKTIAGVTDARFVIAETDAAERMKAGFFQPGASFPATVRLSNASGVWKERDDGDLHGMAVRLHLDGGGEHDLLATNAAVHHADNAKQAMVSVVAGTRGGLRAVLFFLRHGELSFLRISRTTKRQMRQPVGDLATETFWGRAPYAFGAGNDGVVKFRFAPRTAKPSDPHDEPDLTQKFSETVRSQDVVWDFDVQFYIDHARTPVEKGTADWDEGGAAWENVGSLTIPQGDVEPTRAEVDVLAFSPWNLGSNEIRPLGALNRIRNPLYYAARKSRLT